jgi:hypothetical protein
VLTPSSVCSPTVIRLHLYYMKNEALILLEKSVRVRLNRKMIGQVWEENVTPHLDVFH